MRARRKGARIFQEVIQGVIGVVADEQTGPGVSKVGRAFGGDEPDCRYAGGGGRCHAFTGILESDHMMRLYA